jgi:hypothetical protein
MFKDWRTSSSLHRSKRSASAPAGKAKTRFGIVFRKPIRPSVAADPPSRRTTYPNAAASTQLPMRESRTPAE